MNHIELLQKEVETEVQNSEMIVEDAASLEIATEDVLHLDRMKKKVLEYWAEPKKKAHEAWKSITLKESEMIKPIDEARESLKKKINIYLTDQKRKEDAERARLEAIRKSEEDAERARLEAERAKAEEERKALEAEGKTEEAEAKAVEVEMIQVQAEAVYIPPTVPETAMEKTTRTDTGTVSGKEEIQIEIRDKKALLEAMIKDGLLEMVEIKEAKLKTWIKLMAKESYPGLGIEKVVSASFRGKK